MINSDRSDAPLHSVGDLKRFLDSSKDFFVLGTGWQAVRYRQWLSSRGKNVVAFVKSPLLPPLSRAALRHRFSGKAMDIVNTVADHCESVLEDYSKDYLHGLPVLDPETVDWKRARTIICLEHQPIEAICWLRDHGVRPYEDFIAFPDMISFPDTVLGDGAVGAPFFSYLEANRSNFQRARDSFSDADSQRMYDKVIAFRVRALEFETIVPEDQPQYFDTWKRISASYYETRDKYSETVPGFGLLSKAMPEGAARLFRYFNPLGIPPRILHRASWIISSGVFDHVLSRRSAKEPIIIDCGAFEGESSAALAWLSPGSTVYAFEPLPDAFNKLEALSRKLPSIHPVKMGTWHTSGSAALSDADEGSVVSESGASGGNPIQLTSIDDFVEGRALRSVDAIKMNIEGAEMPSLRGARRTIDRFRPSLSICSEHLTSDLWEIPTYLRDTHSDYSLTLKPFGPHVFANYVVAS
jgi:FkbM family methyltransferase